MAPQPPPGSVLSLALRPLRLCGEPEHSHHAPALGASDLIADLVRAPGAASPPAPAHATARPQCGECSPRGAGVEQNIEDKAGERGADRQSQVVARARGRALDEKATVEEPGDAGLGDDAELDTEAGCEVPPLKERQGKRTERPTDLGLPILIVPDVARLQGPALNSAGRVHNSPRRPEGHAMTRLGRRPIVRDPLGPRGRHRDREPVGFDPLLHLVVSGP